MLAKLIIFKIAETDALMVMGLLAWLMKAFLAFCVYTTIAQKENQTVLGYIRSFCYD